MNARNLIAFCLMLLFAACKQDAPADQKQTITEFQKAMDRFVSRDMMA